jgi:hypothetical protein
LRKSGFGYNPKNVQYPNLVYRDNQHFFQDYLKKSIFTKKTNTGLQHFQPVPLECLTETSQTFHQQDQAITLSLHDLEYCLSFNPIKVTRYGTLEIRSTCQQPFQSLFTPVALQLALKLMAEDRHQMPNNQWITHAEQHRLQTNRYHFHLFQDTHLIFKILERLRIYLEGRNLGEEKYLLPLFENLESKTNPALKLREQKCKKSPISYLLKTSLP